MDLGELDATSVETKATYVRVSKTTAFYSNFYINSTIRGCVFMSN